MNFNDVVKQNNEVVQIVKRLEPTINIFNEILIVNKEFVNTVLRYTYKVSFTDNSNTSISNRNELIKYINSYVGDLAGKIKKAYTIEYGIALANLGNIKDSSINEFRMKLIKNSDAIYTFINQESNNSNIKQNIDTLITSINELVEEYNKIIFHNNNINEVSLLLANGTNPGSDEILDLRLLSEEDRVTEAIEILSNINDIYNDICLIGNINTSEQPLRFQRLESGSLLTWLSGNAEVIGLLGGAIAFIYKLYKDNLSKNAKISNMSNKIEALDKCYNIAEKFKEKGYDVNRELEDIKQINGRIIRKIGSLVSKSPEMELNGQMLTISKEEVLLMRQEALKEIAASSEQSKES